MRTIRPLFVFSLFGVVLAGCTLHRDSDIERPSQASTPFIDATSALAQASGNESSQAAPDGPVSTSGELLHARAKSDAPARQDPERQHTALVAFESTEPLRRLPATERGADSGESTEELPLPTHSEPESLNLPLSLDDVLRSVVTHYPLLRIANEQRTIAAGQLLAAQGQFDLKLKSGGTSAPLGFYRNHRAAAGFEQALFSGGELFAGYRIGRGDFQPWYGERVTNEGGEFKGGFLIPLAQNRRIDPRRAEVFRTALGRDAVEPDILLQLIDFTRNASYAYWDWVAAAQKVDIEKALLSIARERREGLKKRIDRGDLPKIELTDNDRLIVSREAALIDARRKFEQTAIKLSLFYRTSDGQPMPPALENVPTDFPPAEPYDEDRLHEDIRAALTARPETQFLDYVRQQLEVDLQQAQNLYLPELNVGATASQDVGAAASSKRDKSPFEFEASVMMSMPLQRRKALGKLQQTRGKLAQVRTKTQFANDKIAAEVKNAVVALNAAYQKIEREKRNVELSLAMENAERRRFAAGDSNLLIVNLREKATADARKTLVAARLEYFQARAEFHAALALVPLADTSNATE